jgi:hypothetical protein
MSEMKQIQMNSKTFCRLVCCLQMKNVRALLPFPSPSEAAEMPNDEHTHSIYKQ